MAVDPPAPRREVLTSIGDFVNPVTGERHPFLVDVETAKLAGIPRLKVRSGATVSDEDEK
jgi:hypothetical protein